jgi:hypothetical protein
MFDSFKFVIITLVLICFAHNSCFVLYTCVDFIDQLHDLELANQQNGTDVCAEVRSFYSSSYPSLPQPKILLLNSLTQSRAQFDTSLATTIDSVLICPVKPEKFKQTLFRCLFGNTKLNEKIIKNTSNYENVSSNSNLTMAPKTNALLQKLQISPTSLTAPCLNEQLAKKCPLKILV